MEDQLNIKCIGFIMDGNRRWAKTKGLQTFEGHRAGYESLKSVVETVYKAHIPHMVCYAFSTENWQRLEDEVSYLMELLGYALRELDTTLRKDGRKINLRVVGQIGRLPENLQEAIRAAESKNYTDPALTVWLALSYGGRAEIVEAVNRAIQEGGEVTEESFGNFLWTDGMPDPDLIIRTSGELRTSNFLIWQSAYSELFFTDTLWPDFGETELKSILTEYGNRKRRKGA